MKPEKNTFCYIIQDICDNEYCDECAELTQSDKTEMF